MSGLAEERRRQKRRDADLQSGQRSAGWWERPAHDLS